MNDSQNQSTRPGLSQAELDKAGVRHVDAAEAKALIGFAESGLILPYLNADGSPVIVNGSPFYRLRLDAPTGSAKYLSPTNSGCQLYVPHGLSVLLKDGCLLAVVEGEFKAFALVAAGFACVGIGGITSACPRNKTTHEPELLPALAALISKWQISRVEFIGDNDTGLNFDFAREAVKLAGLVSVPVALPRIPLDAPGKGPDDLREAWGDSFAARWQAVLDRAEPVTAQTKMTALSVRLLKREQDALKVLTGDAKDKARERIVRLAVAVSDDTLAASDVAEIATGSLEIPKAGFRAAVRTESDRAKSKAAENITREALETLDLDGADPLFFDGGNYWRRENSGAFGKLCREDARLHLNESGLSKKGDPSPCDAALHALQKSNRVDYAGPLCGRPAGLHEENGMRVLATRGPHFTEGVAGECPTIVSLVANLFGRAAGDEHALRQAALFVAWLRLRRIAIRNFAGAPSRPSARAGGACGLR